MVRPPQAAGNEDIIGLAADPCHPFLMGSRLLRILCRIGFVENGGPFNLMQLKVIQEVISLTVFTVIATLLFKNQSLEWNHLAAFICLILAVFFVFMK